MRQINVNFKFCCFLHTVLDPLKQSRLDFSNPKETFVRIQLLEIDYRRSLFSDISCTKREYNFWHSLPILPSIENTRGVNVPWFI